MPFQPLWLLLVDGSVDSNPPIVHVNRHFLSVNEYLDEPGKAPIKMAWSQNGRSNNPPSLRRVNWP